MTLTWKSCLAEIIGTFFLTFAGAGAICVNAHTGGGVGLVGIALAHGLALSVAISAFGAFSGGQFNPAVTIGLLIAKKMKGSDAAAWIVSQLVGSTLAAFALTLILPSSATSAAHLGTPEVAAGIGVGAAILMEAILTFFLLVVIFLVAVGGGPPTPIVGFCIGLTLAFDILCGGPITGASVNPARTFGPALVGGYWSLHHVYWIGPILGAAVASFLYTAVFAKRG
jgi:MIP family channel proteins